MRLFNREKDLMHRIANLVFLVWFVIATVVLYTQVVDFIIVKPKEKYESYKISSCKEISDKSCKENYLLMEFNSELEDSNKKEGSLIAFGNMVIVSLTLVLINREKKPASIKSNKKK